MSNGMDFQDPTPQSEAGEKLSPVRGFGEGLSGAQKVSRLNRPVPKMTQAEINELGAYAISDEAVADYHQKMDKGHQMIEDGVNRALTTNRLRNPEAVAEERRWAREVDYKFQRQQQLEEGHAEQNEYGFAEQDEPGLTQDDALDGAIENYVRRPEPQINQTEEDEGDSWYLEEPEQLASDLAIENYNEDDLTVAQVVSEQEQTYHQEQEKLQALAAAQEAEPVEDVYTDEALPSASPEAMDPGNWG